MLSTILVATDLSSASDHVIGCLHALLPLGARKAILAHALGIKHLQELKYELARLAEPRLAAQKALLEAQGFQTAVEIAPGLPGFEMNRVAREKEVSLIVVGSHGATLAREVLLGGVALSILQSATVPVFLVRLKIIEEKVQNRCEVACADIGKHVLFPTDFSDTSDRAFNNYVEKIVEAGFKRVTLLHVQDKGRIDKHLQDRLEEFNRIDRARLEGLKARLEKKGGTEVQIKIPYGSPIQEILRCAKEEDITLIIMGSQGRGFITEVFLGSVSHQVARHAPVPILLVPALR